MKLAYLTLIITLFTFFSPDHTAAQETSSPVNENACCSPDYKQESSGFKFGDIEFAGGITSVLQRLSGANDTFAPDGRRTEHSWSFDLELTSPAGRNGNIYSLFEAGINAGIDDYLPGFSGFNGDANADGHLRTTEIWYEYQRTGNSPHFRVGKIDLSAAFDTSSFANCEVDQFISPAFVNNPTLEFAPKYNLGAIVWLPFANNWELVAGVVDKFSIYELSFKSERSGRKGNYRVYRWFNQFDHQSLTNPGVAAASNDGYGLSFDQEITKKLGVFARYGRQSDEVAEMDKAWSLGMQYTAPFKNRSNDVIGLAWGQAYFGSPGQAAAALNGISTDAERHLEAYYNFQASEDFKITPSAQWIKNAAGDRANGEAWVFGLRTQINF